MLYDLMGSEDLQCLENALVKHETGCTRYLAATRVALLNEMPCIRMAATSFDCLTDYNCSVDLEVVFVHIPNRPAAHWGSVDRVQ
jgi:hypothetical protein